MSKLVICKRCKEPNLHWTQNFFGKWHLLDSANQVHKCDDSKIMPVKCKYCAANDLYWAEDIKENGTKKMVLTESYGLPHACDEQIAFRDKQRQEKKDKYESEKKRVTGHPNGNCVTCNGNGVGSPTYTVCQSCKGFRYFDERTKRLILASIRRDIWPNMTNSFRGFR